MKKNILLVLSFAFLLVGCEMPCIEDECVDTDVNIIHGMSKLPLGYYDFGNTKEKGYMPNQVSVKAFYLDQTEVTLGDYNKCIESGKCSKPVSAYDQSGCVYEAGDPRHPVNCVTPVQAKEYCASVGKRLPTEIEWEYAAKGIVYSEYPWGNKFDDTFACFNKDKTCMVGSHVETILGMKYSESKKEYPSISPLLDLAGNVAEILDSEYTNNVTDNKSCTGACSVRGGSWLSNIQDELSTTHRAKMGISDHSPAVGFRCARD